MQKFDLLHKGAQLLEAFYKYKGVILPVLLNVRFSKKPFWMMYQPQDYKIKGQIVQKICKVLKPGDIILRGFDSSFIDRAIVPNKHGYTQSGIYIGFNRVVHMTTKGIQNTHVFDFCKADKIAICRPNEGSQKAVTLAKQYLYNQIPYDFFCRQGDKALYCHQFCASCYPQVEFKTFNFKCFGFTVPDWFGKCYLDQSLLDPTKTTIIGIY